MTMSKTDWASGMQSGLGHQPNEIAPRIYDISKEENSKHRNPTDKLAGATERIYTSDSWITYNCHGNTPNITAPNLLPLTAAPKLWSRRLTLLPPLWNIHITISYMPFFNFALILTNIAEWCSFLQATTPILQKCAPPLGYLTGKQIESVVVRENHEPCFFMMTNLQDIDSKIHRARIR